MKLHTPLLLAGTLMLARLAHGGSFSANFDDGLLPGGTQIFGNGSTAGVIETTGGAGGSGCVKLTKNVNGVTGSFIVGDLEGGAAVNGFTANFKMLLGGGSAVPADGCSFCVAGDLPNGTFGEGGAGAGLRIGFDIYDNVDGNPNNGTGEAPAFNAYWNGALIKRVQVPLATMVSNAFVDVVVRINNNGTLDMTWGGAPIFTSEFIGYQPIANARYGWGGRTGGLNTNQFVDDISISSTTGTLTPYIVRHPIAIRMASGYGAPLNVVTNGAPGLSFQWEKQAPGDPSFSSILGAGSNPYVTPALTTADAGTQYRVVVSNIDGTVTSNAATVDVVNLPHATPNATFDFDAGTVPAGSNAYGNATAQSAGGADNALGWMRLTENVNGQAGTWTVDDLNGGLPVESIDVSFKLMLANPTNPPADGFGFHWAPDLPNSGFPTAEEPVGTGLSVCFDVYDSVDGNPFNGGEAPAIDVFWLRNRVGGTTVPLEFMNTNGTFQDVCIRLNNNGLIDVMFNGVVLVYQLQVPNWTAFSAARYGFAARTGGLNQLHGIDSVNIKSTNYTGPLAFLTHPQNASVLPGYGATFTCSTNDPSRTDYQWQIKAPGAPGYTDIPGATSQTLNSDPFSIADDGALVRCHISRVSPASAADSNPATVTVVNLQRPTAPQINDTFDDDVVPPTNSGSAGAVTQTLSGNATVVTDLGVGGSSALRLTEAANSQYGVLTVDDFNAGLPVTGFTAAMRVSITGANPADGWSFSWGDTITQGYPYGAVEHGLGDDLRVGFITYGGSGVGVEAFLGGTLLSKVTVPLDLLQTIGNDLEEVLIRVTPSAGGAKLDVAQGGTMIFSQLDLPGFTPVSGGRFAIAARTGGANEQHIYDDFCIQTTMTPFNQWRLAKFGAEASNPAIGAPGADADNDGVSNINEYGAASDPNNGAQTGFTSELSEGSLSLTYQKSRTATDASWVVEWSDDLTTWNTADITQAVVSDTHPDYQEVKASVSASTARRQLRVRTTVP